MLYICNIKPPGHGQDGSGNTNKSAPRPVQGRREIRRGGLITLPGARWRKRPDAAVLGKPPHKPVFGPRPPGDGRFRTGGLKKAAGDAQANASRPKDAPGASSARPLWKGARQKSRQKRTLTSLETRDYLLRLIIKAQRLYSLYSLGFIMRTFDSGNTASKVHIDSSDAMQQPKCLLNRSLAMRAAHTFDLILLLHYRIYFRFFM